MPGQKHAERAAHTQTRSEADSEGNNADHPPGIPHPAVTYEIQRQIDESHWNPAFQIETTEDINAGYCKAFAVNVYRELPELPIEIVSITNSVYGVGSHYWLRIDGRHYDAEVPKGVDDYTELPYWQRNGEPHTEPVIEDVSDEPGMM